MAETLGSLIDKLTIKNLRVYHLQEMTKGKSFPEEIKEKLAILDRQKKELLREIEGFIVLAIKGEILLKDVKLKLYNPRRIMNKIPSLGNLGEAISYLADKNAELWHLEDEVRRKGVSLSYVGKIKRKIDLANQQRNDSIDKIDALLEKTIKRYKR